MQVIMERINEVVAGREERETNTGAPFIVFVHAR